MPTTVRADATVLVARQLLPAGLDRLAGRAEIREGGLDATPERLLELAPGADAIVADPTVAIDAELLDAAGPQLKVVANFAVGHDNIDLQACRTRGVAVTNTPDVLTNATAELALALTLAAARRMTEAEADLRAGRWTGLRPDGYLGLELSGASFGVVGLGRIGRRYAELVRPMAGEILYAANSPKPEAEQRAGGRARRAGAAARPRRRRQPPRAGDASDRGADRRRRARNDEVARGARQHRARVARRRRRRSPARCARARSAPPASTSMPRSPMFPPSCSRRRTPSCSRTSARRLRRRATRWRSWSPTTCSRRLPGRTLPTASPDPSSRAATPRGRSRARSGA